MHRKSRGPYVEGGNNYGDYNYMYSQVFVEFWNVGTMEFQEFPLDNPRTLISSVESTVSFCITHVATLHAVYDART